MDSKDGAAPRMRHLSIRTARQSDPADGSAGEEVVEGGRGGAVKEGRRLEGERRGEEEPVSPGGRLFHQRGFDCYIVAIMGYAKPIDVGVVKSGLEKTLVRHPRFCSIPVVLDETGGTKSTWVPAKVVVDDHIVIPDLADPRRITTSPDQLVEDYIASLTCIPMDHSRPLWELHVLNFPTSDAAAVAVLRLHHSLGDGVSLMSLLLACTRKSSHPDSLPTVPSHYSRRPPAPKRLHARVFTLLLWLWAFLILTWNTLVDVVCFTATSIFLKDTPTPLMGSQGVEQRPKRIVHRSVSLDDIKDVKNAMHCTINDVLVGVTSAGLSRYLSRRQEQNSNDDDKNKKKKKKELPSNLRLRSTLLVNIRPAPGIHALAELMEGRDDGTKWGNLIGYIILPFEIFNHKDPLDYVRRGKAIADRKKNSLEAIFTYKSAELVVKCLGIKAAAKLCHRMLTHTTLSFSNMVGPVEEIEFFGHPLVYLAPSAYGHPQALTIHFQSYMNTMKIVLAVDDKVISDPHQLLVDFAESLKIIREAIPARS
ncbi:wax ester synthase/diacylglycerol acyltransferase 11-like [Musa acuminata AAA Group]|uniref:wax ester synthase/diacylglycerol acyltransferase 11-like n=1 Tax=Musa acuminata AAA Group TaxID=214697 RepID=UPI0031D80AE7